jgi:hypothetical protein
MKTHLSWQYDEFKQVGRDYGSPMEVEVYDSSHGDFRDLEAESNEVLDSLAVKAGYVLIDFGSGTAPSRFRQPGAATGGTPSMFHRRCLTMRKPRRPGPGVEHRFLSRRTSHTSIEISLSMRVSQPLLSTTCQISGRELLYPV